MTSEPSYYSNHAVKTCIKQDMIADILEEAGVPARRIKEATTAVKYIDRLGEKDPVEVDSFKAANYLHRFLTGRFIGEETDTSRSRDLRQIADDIRTLVNTRERDLSALDFAIYIADAIDPEQSMKFFQVANKLADLIDPDRAEHAK